MLEGLQAGVTPAELARNFHEALLSELVATALLARDETALETVALSGGVFNNRFMATHLPPLLQSKGFQVLTHHHLPPNDGCISYGQAAVACAQLKHLGATD